MEEMNEKEHEKVNIWLAFGNSTNNQESTTDSTMTVGSEQKSGKGIYRITGIRKTVTFVKPLNDKNTSFNVPASVKLADGRYKVTAINKNAFKNNRKLKKVTIGNKVT